MHTQHRTGNTGIINTQRAGAYQNPNAPAACSVAANSVPRPYPDRGCQSRNSVAADSQSLPYPSRKPPTRGRQYICTSSPQSKKHISPGTLLVRSALSSRYLTSSMPALDSSSAPVHAPSRARLPTGPRCLHPPRAVQPSPAPPPTPSVITLPPASRARRARSHTFRFSS